MGALPLKAAARDAASATLSMTRAIREDSKVAIATPTRITVIAQSTPKPGDKIEFLDEGDEDKTTNKVVDIID